MEIKENLLFSMIRDIILRDNFVIVVHERRQEIINKQVAYFLEKNRWDYISDSVVKEFGISVYYYKDMNFQNDKIYLKDKETTFILQSKYLLEILGNLLEQDSLPNVKKTNINNKLIFNNWGNIKDFIVELYKDKSLIDCKESLETMYKIYTSKISEKSIMDLIHIHKELKLSSTSMESFIENHKEYLTTNSIDVLHAEFPKIIIPKKESEKNLEDIKIYIEQPNRESLLGWIAIDFNKLKEKYPFSVKGKKTLKVESYQEMIKNIIMKNNYVLNMDYFGVNNLKIEDNYNINITYKKKVYDDNKNEVLYFIENYISQIEKMFIKDIEGKDINIMGMHQAANTTLKDIYNKLSENNDSIRDYLLTSFALKDNNKGLNSLNIKKIKI